MTSPDQALKPGKVEVLTKPFYMEEVTMSKSCTSSSQSVKQAAKLSKELAELLRPDLNEIVQQSLNDYVADGVRLLLELLMQAEAQLRCGDKYVRNGKRAA